MKLKTKSYNFVKIYHNKIALFEIKITVKFYLQRLASNS